MGGGNREFSPSFCESTHTACVMWVSCDTRRRTTRILTADISDIPRRLFDNGTFMVTNHVNSTASLTFNGTAVWLYGSKSNSTGAYKVTLDGSANSTFVGDGFSEQNLFHQVLFEAEGLDGNKTHQLTVENVGTAGRMYLVIDSVSRVECLADGLALRKLDVGLLIGTCVQIVHEVGVADDYQEFKEQDLSSSFEYSPSAWSTEVGNLTTYDGNTGQQVGSPKLDHLV
jgi:hypothetical protein